MTQCNAKLTTTLGLVRLRQMCILICSMVSVFLLPHISSSQTMRTGRSTALAGSSAMLMYGAQAAGWNPANLGLKANPEKMYLLPSAGMAFDNNAYSPRFISDNFQPGVYLDSTDKVRILDKLKSDRLKVNGILGVPVFGISSGRYAFNFDTHVFTSLSLPADLFEMALNGPGRDVEYDFSSLEQMTLGYWAISFSLGHPLKPLPMTKEFAVGATFKYIGGITYSELDRKNATFQITDEKVLANGFTRFLSSSSGDGVGLDLAAAGRLDYKDIYVGLMIGNLIGSIFWNDVEARERQYFRDAGIDFDSIGRSDYFKNFFSESDSIYDFNSVTSALPRYFILSADIPCWKDCGDILISYYQGLNKIPGQSTTPRLSAGVEYRHIPVLPVRLGMAVGGVEVFEFSGGFGFTYKDYQLNIGASWQRGVFAGAKGFAFALTHTIGRSVQRKGF